MTTSPPSTVPAKCFSETSSTTIAMPFVDVDDDLTTKGNGGNVTDDDDDDEDDDEDDDDGIGEGEEEEEEEKAATGAEDNGEEGQPLPEVDGAFDEPLPSELLVDSPFTFMDGPFVDERLVEAKCIRTDFGLEHFDRCSKPFTFNAEAASMLPLLLLMLPLLLQLLLLLLTVLHSVSKAPPLPRRNLADLEAARMSDSLFSASGFFEADKLVLVFVFCS